MKKFILWTIIILFVLVVHNPAFWPVSCIRSYVLMRIPAETSMTKAEEKIYYWTSWDMNKFPNSQGPFPNDNAKTQAVVKCIKVHLGEYKIPFVTCDAVAYLGFDEDEKLIDVSANKEYDSL